MANLDPTGHTVIILAGEFAGEEGVCLGPATGDPGKWAVSPNCSNRIVGMVLDRDFGILVNPGQEAGRN